MHEPPFTPVKYTSADLDLRSPDPIGGVASSAYDYIVRSPQPGNGQGPLDFGLQTPKRSCRSSPQKSPLCEYSDRLIPSRAATDLDAGFAILEAENEEPRSAWASSSPPGDSENSHAYARLLRDELLGQSPGASTSAGGSGNTNALRDLTPATPEKRPAGLFHYRSSPDAADDEVFARGARSLAPGSGDRGRKQHRKVAKEPFRVLHAPNLQDDFYLNCLSNSCSDVLAVALGRIVDLWSARTERCTQLCDLGPRYGCTSVAWSQDGELLAVGRHNGEVQVWDAARSRRVRTFNCHERRVGALAWNGHTLSTGSRDHDILQHDMRQSAPHYARLRGHNQEVCGLSWSPDGQQLASGGNEGFVCIWSAARSSIASPVHRFSESEAAVRALGWSPHQRGLLASGGGTADKCIRFWNTLTGNLVSSQPTGAQVCNLAWSKNVDEIVSTHGFSLNEVVIWKYPTMTKVATLSGHCARALHLAMSADGRVIITGAGDETLRFWHAFPACSRRLGFSDLRSGPSSLGRTIR